MTVTVSGHYVRADCPKCEGTGRTTWRGLPAYCEACDPTAPVVPVAVIPRAELMPGVDPDREPENRDIYQQPCSRCGGPLYDWPHFQLGADRWHEHCGDGSEFEDCWDPGGDE